jgi:hypothetical protein
MFKPPFMMCMDFAAAPLSTIDLFHSTFKTWKVDPIITMAGDITRIAPIIILVTVGSAGLFSSTR